MHFPPIFLCHLFILCYPLCSDSDTPTGPSQQPAGQRPSTPPQSSRPFATFATASSPFKSYLSASGAAFAKSPLKAASDRILRKYTSPLKKRQSLREGIRRRTVFSPVKAGTITPRRLVTLAPPSKGGSCGTPPGALSGTPPSVAARCRSSPALVSPREEDQDTPTAGGRRKTRHQKVRLSSRALHKFSVSSNTGTYKADFS